jgi:hypothetical protein
MWGRLPRTAGWGLLLLLLLLTVFFTDRLLITEPANLVQQVQFVQQVPTVSVSHLLTGKTPSLSWIFGRDCQSGLQAYLQTATADPNLALVGTGWVDPTSGNLMVGHNNCVSNSHSMDAIVELVHSKGGMAYLTITMQTDNAPDAWTPRQAADYINRAAADPRLLASIVHEATRGNYDGVIMDLEGVDATFPSIQQLFARYNQQLWSLLQPLHKWYGIALLHKLSDRDEYYSLNAFQNWHLLAHNADFLVIMAVDQSYFTPGPCVSVPWLKQLLAYALENMPDMLPRIIWELPLYGNSWHWENNAWVFDGDVTYQDAYDLVQQLSPTQIDSAASNLQDISASHVVYTDVAGVKHTLWYPTAKSLYIIVTGFWQVLQQESQFDNNRLFIAVWWRTTLEPGGFWPLLDALYPE